MSREVSNADILQEIKNSKTELRSAIVASESRLLLKLEEANRRILQLEGENKILNKRLQYFERQSRANNIVIRGLTLPDTVEIPDFVISELERLLGIKLSLTDLNDAFVIGRRSPQSLIKVEFISKLKRSEVLKNSSKLKGSNIYINPDLTLEERQENRVLRDRLRIEKNKGNKCYIKHGKLYVSEKVYTAEDIARAEEETPRTGTGSEPTSLLSTPEAVNSRIFKTHQIVLDKTTIENQADRKALGQAEVADEVAALVTEIPEEAGTGVATRQQSRAPKLDLKDTGYSRVRKGSGSGNRGMK